MTASTTAARRRLGRTIRVTLTAVVVVSVALAGCGKSHDEPASSPTSTDAGEVPAATTDIDTLTWNLPGGEPASLDPARTYGGSDLLVDANLCESLLTLTPEGDVVPGLAESIDQPDDRTYVVHLRPDVTFTDGSAMTADDVVYSMERVRDPKTGSYWGFFAQSVDTITATDESTVTITMKAPDAIFYRMLATPMSQVVQQAYAEQEGERFGGPDSGVMCTGPYSVQTWDRGNRIVLAANQDWWGRDDNPQHAATVELTFLTDDSTVTSALLNGDIDGSFDIPTTTIEQLRTSDRGSVYMGPSTKQLVLIPTDLNGDGPLADPEARQALAASIDYAGIARTTLGGTAEPLRAIVPPGAWGSATEQYQEAYDALPAAEQDLDRAADLVESAGIADEEIVLAVPASIPAYVALGETIQSNARQAGLDVTLEPLPGADFAALYGSADARSKVDVFLADYYADIPDPTELYMQIGIPGGAADFGGYDNPEVADLLTQARQTADDEERAALTIEAQAAITADLVWIPLSYPLQTVFLSDDLGGASAAFPYVMYAPWLPAVGGV